MGKLKVRYDCFCSEDVKIRNKRKAESIKQLGLRRVMV